jgi:hypothetical protein
MPFAKRHRLALQFLAFLAIMLPSIGLYFSAGARVDLVSGLLVGAIAAGMLISIWAS